MVSAENGQWEVDGEREDEKCRYFGPKASLTCRYSTLASIDPDSINLIWNSALRH
ncbi:MAG: hypothetical protein M1294_04010 [Firmicutes bacterium]|nr:hypothetical protein [Bacillota bacterium]MCL5013689.1 hypothetical protein [Bacillota bacterium]